MNYPKEWHLGGSWFPESHTCWKQGSLVGFRREGVLAGPRVLGFHALLKGFSS